jgi:hypothetical protein
MEGYPSPAYQAGRFGRSRNPFDGEESNLSEPLADEDNLADAC